MNILEHIAKVLGESVPTEQAEINTLVRRAARSEDKLLNKLPESARDYLESVRLAIRAKKSTPKPPVEAAQAQVEEEKDAETEYDVAPTNLLIENFAEIMTVTTLVASHKSGRIQLPLFQRKFIWGPKMQQELIDSMLLGVALPDFLLASESAKDTRVLLDGFQRTSTIQRFTEDLITTGLRLPEAYRNKKFSQLPVELQNTFLNFKLVVQESRTNRENWPFMFSQRNRGGAPLNAMEIRRVAFPYALVGALEEVSEHNTQWVTLFGKNERYLGLGSLIRAHAMHDNFQNYTKGMNVFLDEYCETLPHYKPEELAIKKHGVNYIIEMLHDHVGPLALRTGPKKAVNLGLVDALFHAAFIMLASDMPSAEVGGQILNKVRTALLNDDEALYALTQNTSTKKSIQTRMDKAERVVADLLLKVKKPVATR